MAFQLLVDLAECIQPIKSKYPMVVSYYKHLQKCAGNNDAESKEISRFVSWMKENPDLPKISQPYLNSKMTVCFTNVYSTAAPDVIGKFESKLVEIKEVFKELVLFSPSAQAANANATATATVPFKINESEVTPGVANAMAEIQRNPAFSDLIDNIKATVEDTDIQNDPSGVLENENFQKLLKNIQGGLKSGKFKISDLTSTIHNVIGSVQDELDPETREVVTSAVGMMNEAENGQQPNIGKIVDMLKNLNFNS